MIFTDPPRHTKLRSIVVKAFTPRSIAGLEPRIRELSRELVDRTIERGEMDLCADYAVQLPLLVIAEMLGIPIGTVMSRLHRGRKFLQKRLLDLAQERGIAAVRATPQKG